MLHHLVKRYLNALDHGTRADQTEALNHLRRAVISPNRDRKEDPGDEVPLQLELPFGPSQPSTSR